MGAGNSKPPPPPRVSKKLPGTTVQVQYLPPLISPSARDGIRKAYEMRSLFLADDIKDDSRALVETHQELEALIVGAHRAGVFRDYLSLLIDKAMLGLCTRSGGPGLPALETACLVNPFLQRDGLPRLQLDAPAQDQQAGGIESLRFASAFRPCELDLVTDDEKDILVLLYYSSQLEGNADEAIDFISRFGDKYTKDTLERRKESFSETEIYALWATSYLTSYFVRKPPGLRLSASSASKLQVETGRNLDRLLSVCEMLLLEHRLDQICFLLQFLDVQPQAEAQAWYPPRVRTLAKGMRKKKGSDRALREWHVDFADGVVRRLKTARDTGRDRFGRSGGSSISVGDGWHELHRLKKD